MCDRKQPTDEYPDPWGPGGKFIETGLHKIDEEDEDELTDDA